MTSLLQWVFFRRNVECTKLTMLSFQKLKSENVYFRCCINSLSIKLVYKCWSYAPLCSGHLQHQPAVLPTASEPPPYTAPSASATAAVAAATDDLKRRQEELDRKALDLERRERDMQENVQHSGVHSICLAISVIDVEHCYFKQSLMNTHWVIKN